MVTETESYIHIIEYLTEHLSLFECNETPLSNQTVLEVIEQELSEQIIMVCSQNDGLDFEQRNYIIRDVDAILYDLQEILSSVVDNKITEPQLTFIKEFALLIKNVFDTEIHQAIAERGAQQ